MHTFLPRKLLSIDDVLLNQLSKSSIALHFFAVNLIVARGYSAASHLGVASFLG